MSALAAHKRRHFCGKNALSCGGLAGRFGGAVASLIGMIENRRAASSDGETQLVERKGERHTHRLVELLAFALMHDCDDKIASAEPNTGKISMP